MGGTCEGRPAPFRVLEKDLYLRRVAGVVLCYYSGVWALVTTLVVYAVRPLPPQFIWAVHHGGRICDCEVRRASIGRAPDGAFGSAGVRGAMLHRGGRDVTRTALRLGGAFISF